MEPQTRHTIFNVSLFPNFSKSDKNKNLLKIMHALSVYVPVSFGFQGLARACDVSSSYL
jgi:hypothetical protein